MAALIHLALMLAALALAALLVRRYGGKPTGARIAATFAALVVPLFSLGAGVHRCDCGVPLFQWVLPSLALLAVVLLVEPMKPRVLAAIALSATSFGLSFHYAALVHDSTWVGNPRSMTLEAAGARREWHTPLTGLYRRLPAN